MWPDCIPRPANPRKHYSDPVTIEGECWLWNWNKSQKVPILRRNGQSVSAP